MEVYEFDEESYAAVAASSADLPSVLAVLRGHPVHRAYVAPVYEAGRPGQRPWPFVTGTGQVMTGHHHGQLISVGLLRDRETQPDRYHVVEVAMLPQDRAVMLDKQVTPTRNLIRQTIAEHDLTDTEQWRPITEPRSVAVVLTHQLPAEWNDEILAETQRRGLADPSQLVNALLRQGLDRAQSPAPGA